MSNLKFFKIKNIKNIKNIINIKKNCNHIVMTILILANLQFSFAENIKQEFRVKEYIQASEWDKALLVLNELESEQKKSISQSKGSLLKTIQWVKSHLFILKKQSEPARVELSQLINDETWGGDAAIGMAKIAIDDKNYDEALQLLNLAESKKLSPPLVREIIYEKAIVLIKLKKWNEARKFLTQKNKLFKTDTRYSEWLLLIAKVEFELKNYKKSCDAIKKNYVKYPVHKIWESSAPFIKNIKILDVNISCDINDELFSDRRKQLISLGYPSVAQKEIGLWIEKYNLIDFDKDKLIASQFIQDGNFLAALDLYLKYYKTRNLDYNYLTSLSSIASRSGEIPLAIGSILRASKIATETRKPKLARQSLFQAAILSYQSQDYDGAQNLFGVILKKHKRSRFAVEAQWYIAWIQYLKGHYTEATSLMADIRGATHQEKIKYWLAMGFLKNKNMQQAYNLFSNILESSAGLTFYSLAASQRVEELKSKYNFVFKPGDKNSRNPANTLMGIFHEDVNAKGIKDDEGTDEATASDIAAVEEGKAEDDSAGEVSEGNIPESMLEFQDRLEKAHNLRLFGFEDYAQSEFKELELLFIKKNKGKKLIEEYQEFQDYNRLSSLSHSLWQRQGAPSITSNTRSLWENMYPQAFKEDVIKWSKEFAIAPGFIWGIMRAESQYRPWVISPVGALGLMQVMPFTGKKVADQLGEKNFDPNTLKTPSVAIRFGAKYMEKLSRNFQNSVPLMAAAYNAGPHRVQNWIYHFGYLDIDEWVEHIPFTETRNYVKRVVSNYSSYQALYGEKIASQIVVLNQSIPLQISEPLPMIETW